MTYQKMLHASTDYQRLDWLRTQIEEEPFEERCEELDQQLKTETSFGLWEWLKQIQHYDGFTRDVEWALGMCIAAQIAPEAYL